MNPIQRIELLNCPMDMATLEDTVIRIRAAIEQGHFLQHSVVNVAKVVTMQTNPQLHQAVAACDLINIDGMGVVWGGRFLGHPIPQRVAGIDLFLRLVAEAAHQGWPIYLLGAKPAVVAQVAEKLTAQHPNLVVAGQHHGYFWQDEAQMVDNIAQSNAKLLFVAISSPKKEQFINRWGKQLNVSFVMGVGGSFDVVAGQASRAPVWMQRYGLEWFHRLLQEPKRMFGRYLVTNSRFAWLVIKARWQQRKAP